MSDLAVLRARAAARKRAAEAGSAPQPKVIMQDVGGVDGGRIVETNSGRTFVSSGFSTADPMKVEALMRGATLREVMRSDFDQAALDQYPKLARATKALEGVPFVGTYTDEAAGAVFGEGSRDAMRTLNAAMDRQNPNESLALQLGGGVLGAAPVAMAAPAGAVASAASKLRTIPGILAGAGIGAAGGATEGAVAGFGRGENLEERKELAGEGATFGAVAGGAVGAASPVVAKAMRNVVDLFRRSDVSKISQLFQISPDAAKVIKSTFEAGGDVEAARDALQRAGSQGMLADAGEAAARLTDLTIVNSPQAADLVTGAINTRAAASRKSLDVVFDEVLGPSPAGPRTALADISRRTAGSRKRAFDAAFAKDILPDSRGGEQVNTLLSRIARIDDKALLDAVDRANRRLAFDNVDAPLLNITRHPETNAIQINGTPNVQQLHQLKIQLREIGEAAMGEFGKETDDSRLYKSLAKEVRDVINQVSPDYKLAMQLGGDKIGQEEAYMLGAKLLRSGTNLEDITEILGSKPTPSQRAAARAGLRQAVDKVMGDARALASDPNIDARQLKAAFDNMNSANSQAKIRALLGKDADKILKELEAAQQSLLLRSQTARQSATAARQAGSRAVDEITSPGAVGELMAARPSSAVQKTVQALTGMTDEYTQQQKQRLYNEVGKALTQYRGRDAQMAFEALRYAIAGQPLTEASSAALANALTSIGFTLPATTTGTRGLLAEEDRLTQR